MAGVGKSEKPSPSNGSGISAVIELIGYVREDVQVLRSEMKEVWILFSERVRRLEDANAERVGRANERAWAHGLIRWSIERTVAVAAICISVVGVLAERLSWF